MSEKKVVKPVALAVGAALASSFAISNVASADTLSSPFSMTTLSAGYMLGHGEGSCGGDKEKKGGEGSCGEGSCGEESEGEGVEESKGRRVEERGALGTRHGIWTNRQSQIANRKSQRLAHFPRRSGAVWFNGSKVAGSPDAKLDFRTRR